MAMIREQFAFPFQVAPNGTIATVEQGSDDEIAACMAVVLSWPLGTREGMPEFGLEEQAFLNAGANLDEIRQALQTSEPRALTDIVADDTQLENFVERVRVGFTQADQQPEQ